MKYAFLVFTLIFLTSLFALPILKVRFVLRHFISDYTFLMRKGPEFVFTIRKRLAFILKNSDLEYSSKNIKTFLFLEYCHRFALIFFFVFSLISMYLFMERPG